MSMKVESRDITTIIGSEGEGAGEEGVREKKMMEVKVLLITANVGSIFEDVEVTLPQWLGDINKTVKEKDPHFLAIHMQEVGGKNYKTSMKYLDTFLERLDRCPSFHQYTKRMFHCYRDFTTPHFTALGSIYYIHPLIADSMACFDFSLDQFTSMPQVCSLHRPTPSIDPMDALNRSRRVKNLDGKDGVAGVASDAQAHEADADTAMLLLQGPHQTIPPPLYNYTQHEKFPESFFPQCSWSRKGFLRTRWRFGHDGQALDLINVHLFHDDNNLLALERTPSVYAENRIKAFKYVMRRCNASESIKQVYFGDVNFRLDLLSVVKMLSGEASPQKTRNSDGNETRAVYRVATGNKETSNSSSGGGGSDVMAQGGLHESANEKCNAIKMMHGDNEDSKQQVSRTQSLDSADSSSLASPLPMMEDDENATTILLHQPLPSNSGESNSSKNNDFNNNSSSSVYDKKSHTFNFLEKNLEQRDTPTAPSVVILSSSPPASAGGIINGSTTAKSSNHAHLLQSHSIPIPRIKTPSPIISPAYPVTPLTASSSSSASLSSASSTAAAAAAGNGDSLTANDGMDVDKRDNVSAGAAGASGNTGATLGLPVGSFATTSPSSSPSTHQMNQSHQFPHDAIVIEKKTFIVPDPGVFLRNGGLDFLPFNLEQNYLDNPMLYELPIQFCPSYPFSEDPNSAHVYMTTRCPSWCDRILMTQAFYELVQSSPSVVPEYDCTAKYVGVGDHKPVILTFSFNAML